MFACKLFQIRQEVSCMDGLIAEEKKFVKIYGLPVTFSNFLSLW